MQNSQSSNRSRLYLNRFRVRLTALSGSFISVYSAWAREELNLLAENFLQSHLTVPTKRTGAVIGVLLHFLRCPCAGLKTSGAIRRAKDVTRQGQPRVTALIQLM